MPKFTNISNGPRGLHTDKGLLMVDPSETVDVTLAVYDLKDGKKSDADEPNEEWFAKAGSADAKAAGKEAAPAT